jgi:hypothetical protein
MSGIFYYNKTYLLKYRFKIACFVEFLRCCFGLYGKFTF